MLVLVEAESLASVLASVDSFAEVLVEAFSLASVEA